MGDEGMPPPQPAEEKPDLAPPAASDPHPQQSEAPAAPAAAPKPANKEKAAEKPAKAAPTDLNSLNVRQYLEATVVAVLLKGLQEVVKQRPEDPLDYLAHFLLKHNPKKQGDAAAGGAK